MKAARWIGFVAARYVSKGRRNSPSPVLAVIGIATGVLALTVIIAVMNGFQLGFIESILEISSGHLRIEGLPQEEAAEFSGKLLSVPGVVSVLPFREASILLRGRHSNPRGALVRGVPADALERDPGLAGRLEMEDGYFDLHEPGSIVLGALLAEHLFVWAGDELNILSLSGGLGAGDDDEDDNQVYTVTGIFRSGFYEYDLGWAFVNMETAAKLSGIFVNQDEDADEPALAAPPVLGIKLRNRWHDQQAMNEIRKLMAISGIQEGEGGVALSSWRDYNRAFFGALRTEKLMMFILVGLIFIVVGLNIFQAQRRTVLEKREEIGLLRALGASDTEVRLVFAWDGFIIGMAGAGLGLGIGLLIAFNISAFFTFLEGAVNFFVYAINELSWRLGGRAGPEEFAVFSPQVFYIKEIPSRVIPHEVILIFLFGFLSALSAAWFASGKVSGLRPAEVLRYE